MDTHFLSYFLWTAVIFWKGRGHPYNAMATVGGNARGVACVFPFIYRGNTYHACTTENHDREWCSVEYDYSVHKLWGNCPQQDVCLSHITLSDPWRNVAFNLTSFSGYPKCDHRLAEGWYRFTGIGGDVLPEICILSNRGGTDTPLWLKDPHPSLGVGVKGINVCSTSQNKCCSGTFVMNVLACPGDYYVYYLGQPSCSQSFVVRHSNCTASSCGPCAQCTDNGGCICSPGFRIPSGHLPAGNSYGCTDINECSENPAVCGPNANCTNTEGGYKCSCHQGYRAPPGVTLTNSTQPCKDINECQETPQICGNNAICNNTAGSLICTCQGNLIPWPNINWQINVTVCKGVTDAFSPTCQNEIKDLCILNSLNSMIENSTSVVLPLETVKTLLNVILSTLGSLAESNNVNSTDIAKAGNAVLQSSEKLAALAVRSISTNKTPISITTIELCAFVIPSQASLSKTPQLQAKDNFIDIDLMGIAKKNNGEGAVVFMTYSNMESVLSPNLFSTENDIIKTMMSRVVSASLPMTPNTELTAPVNFTLKHISVFVNNSELTCVYWNRSAWVIDGCSVSESNATHTVCTCSHLSTFALIMQTEQPPEDNSLIKLLGTIGISVGLVFLALALLTFICCHWNPKVNNTARLNLCLCLFLAHLLFQLVQTFLSQIRHCQLACAVVSGILHYLFLSSFVWMNLEALQLFLLVRNLRDVKVIKREGLHWGFLLFVGYGFPCLVVTVSAAVFPEGYGNEECWLKTEKGFRWSFLAPVGYILACNSILFMGIIGYLSATFADLHSDISQMRDTRVMAFKAMLQFFILGCSWILGFLAIYSKMLELLFLFFNSQQGTFIFIVHCALNKDVQVQYRRWFEKLCFSREILDYTSSTSMTSTM